MNADVDALVTARGEAREAFTAAEAKASTWARVVANYALEGRTQEYALEQYREARDAAIRARGEWFDTSDAVRVARGHRRILRSMSEVTTP